MAIQKLLHNADLARPNAWLLFLLAAAIAIAVFAVDTLTPLDIAVAVLYVIVVLLVAHTGARRITIATAYTCVALTLLGFELSHAGDYTAGATARCAVSLLAIATTAFLAIRNQTNTRRLREQVQLLNLTHDLEQGRGRTLWLDAGRSDRPVDPRTDAYPLYCPAR
jgi:hypothetical protein